MAKKETTKKKGFWAHWIVRNLVIAGIIAIVLLFGSMIFLNVATQHNDEIEVPDFRGMTVAEAQIAAQKAGMRVEVADSVYSKRNRGCVRGHNPQPGTMVKQGRRVLLTVNAVNAKKVAMPDLVGYSSRQAAAELSTRGLVLGRLIYKEDMATNNVLSQQYKGQPVAPGKLLEAESVVDLVVGLNDDDNETLVPNVTGRTAEDAIRSIHDHYLNVRTVKYDSSVQTYEDSLAAVVYRQNPEPSELSVGLGTDVSIYLKVEKESEEE
ncbi:MAG: PASTA domain-containing protein [Bacteroidales bacterium]|nr:PASTA domain-containing protein [Bacteroidales bacterium]